jgi:hypothetical protein
MNDSENFLTRWSRRKRKNEKLEEELDQKHKDESNIDVHAPVENGEQDTASTKKAEAKETEKENKFVFDLKNLPPIESIIAGTDIRPFLAPGVPAELTRAALRRAWIVDPAIRDFVGLSENAWDFTKPDAISGFGPLQMTDDLKRIVMEMFEHVVPASDEASTDKEMKAPLAAESAKIATPEKINIQQAGNFIASADISQENIALQQDRSAQKIPDRNIRRGHGSALPKLV